MSEYSDDDLLALSGIQHFAFCKRQWALIHLEKQWDENLRTMEGKLLHERVHDSDFFEARGDILTTRSVPLSSRKLGLYGVSDAVEFCAAQKAGIQIPGRPGFWLPVPVEYKRGSPKKDVMDELQLCAQAVCLEEMLDTKISFGYLYYGETRHRTKVAFDQMLRDQVTSFSKQMHDLYEKQITPDPDPEYKNCRACSLFDVCLPKLFKKKRNVANYIQNNLEQE